MALNWNEENDCDQRNISTTLPVLHCGSEASLKTTIPYKSNAGQNEQ